MSPDPAFLAIDPATGPDYSAVLIYDPTTRDLRDPTPEEWAAGEAAGIDIPVVNAGRPVMVGASSAVAERIRDVPWTPDPPPNRAMRRGNLHAGHMWSYPVKKRR